MKKKIMAMIIASMCLAGATSTGVTAVAENEKTIILDTIDADVATKIAEDSLDINEDVKDNFRVYETYSDEYTKPERRLVQDFKSIMRLYNVPLRGAFTDYKNIDDVLESKEVLGKYYVVEYEDGSLKFYNEELTELKSTRRTIKDGEWIDLPYIDIPEKAFERFKDVDFVKKYISPEAETKNVYFLSGESSMMGTAIYYRTSVGDYVYYDHYSIGEKLFPVDDFCEYQQEIWEELAKNPDTDGGGDLPEVRDLSEYELQVVHSYSNDIMGIMGDVNCDGIFNIADFVLLQKWLLSVPNAKLINWEAADFCVDGKLDVFDLCLMKKALIEKRHEVASDFYMSVTGYSNELLKLAWDDNSDVIITSTSELSDYIEQVYPEDKEQRLNSMKSKFNEDFFENNVLLLKAIYLPDTGHHYSIDNVSYKKNKLIIDYTCKLDGWGCDVVGGLHGVVIIPKENYHADSVEWRLTTINPFGIKSGYIAVFNGEDDNTIHQTYVYKVDNGAANYGFEYINADFNTNNWFVKVTGEGCVMWTDGVFPIAEANEAYDYVTIPGDETKYTIDEFMARFLMN